MKKLKLLSAVLLTAGISFTAQAQTRCLTTEYTEHQIQQDPSMALRMQQIEDQTQEYVAKHAGDASESGVIYTIPVVFHVVYNGSAENLSDADLLSQLDVLNEDFRRTNADASSTISSFVGIAADAEIEFCLADTDPTGAATTGITRTSTTVSAFSAFTDNVKHNSTGGIDAWPRDDYLNIWVCDISAGILGYAQFPGGPASTDGVVLDYKYTGRLTATYPYHLGRSGSHEVGHWLNLRHIWGDGGCGVDDLVSDTPVSDGAHYGCPLSDVSCGTLDNVQNYMDYSDDACMNMFSAGQATRMRATLAPGGVRASLASSPGCSGTAVSCETSDVPSGLSSSVGASNTTLSWTTTAQSVGCQVKATRTSPSGPTITNNSLGSEVSSLVVPNTVFGAGTTWDWKVRCACQISPSVSATAFSPTSSFSIPVLRAGEEFANVELFPNPALENLSVRFNSQSAGSLNIEVVDMLGRVLHAEQSTIDAGSQQIDLNVTDFADGVYFIRMQTEELNIVRQFTVSH